MIIKVTQKHIKKGKTMSTDFCPIALAMTEYFTNKYKTEVGVSVAFDRSDTALVHGPMGTDEYELPDKAVKWYGLFDSGIVGNPFKFSLRRLK